MSITGRCLCEGIRFEVEGPTNWCGHCHCSLCRRAHGAGYVTWVGVDLERFRITEGEELLNWYQSTPEARRGFCSRCGSPLFFTGDRWAEEMHIALAHMDGPVDREPQGHVFFDSRAGWVRCEDGLPKYGGDTGTEPIEEA
jgi:hypothetical protein